MRRLSAKRREADLLKSRVEKGVPERGIAMCTKGNPNGFVVGKKYTFLRDKGNNYWGSFSRIHVHGDRITQYHQSNWDWVFIDNEVEFHTYFTII